MRLPPLLDWAIVVFGCLASGVLECGGAVRTPAQARGAQLYERMCAVCHGKEGQGYAADQAPALAHPYFASSVSDNFLTKSIANGRSGTTMSAWSRSRGGPLSAPDIDALLAFLHGWQDGPRATLDERRVTGSADRGAQTFARECQQCHGPRGTEGPNVHIGNFDFLSSVDDGFLRYAILHGRPGKPMPAFESKLGQSGVEDVLALLRSWQTQSSAAPLPAPARTPPIPLGPVPLHPHGPEPVGFRAQPQTTPADVIKAQLDRGARMAILDARAPSDYLNLHIAGAVSVPFYDPSPYIDALPKDAWLVCYCGCPHAESGTLAQKLGAKGFTKVTVLDEGLPVWTNRKYPTNTGVDP